MVKENATGLAAAQLLKEGARIGRDEEFDFPRYPAPNLNPQINPLSADYLPFHRTSSVWGASGIALFSFNTGLT